MALSAEERKQLTNYIIASPANALRIRKESPRLVEEAIHDKELVTQLAKDPVLFSALILGLMHSGYQMNFLNSRSKRVVLRWPRQSGKTFSLAAYAIWFAVVNEKTTTLIVAPTQRQSMILNDVIVSLVEGIPPKIRKIFVRRRLRTITYLLNHSKIVALPNSSNLLRGYTAHLIILDEAAFFQNDEEIFQNVLPPMLATTQGKMIVSSTPWGKNTQYYRVNMDPSWEVHHASWRDARDAGLYKQDWVEEVERVRETLPLTYRMEYEAEFSEDVDTWLTQDLLAKACYPDVEYLTFNEAAKGDFYAGMDLGESVDYTALAVVRRVGNELHLAYMYRFPLGTSLAACIGHINVLGRRWNRIHATYVDSTKHGEYIVNDMSSAGAPKPKGIFFTQETKQEMAQMMKQRLAEGRLKLPYDRSLLNELNAEQYELTKTGRISLTHATGTHDDRFWALALATYAAESEALPSKPIVR